MALVPDQKFSTFQVGGTPTTGDIIVGLRDGINTQFDWVLPSSVLAIIGSTNQIYANGTSGSPTTGSITLTTPQDIATTSSPTFAGVQTPTILGADALTVAAFSNNSALDVNYFEFQSVPAGASPEFNARGTDTDIGLNFNMKGAGYWSLSSTANNPFRIYSGTAYQHLTRFTFSDTLADRTVTFQDASGTVAYTSDLTGYVTSVSGTANRITSTGGTTPVIDISASYVGQTSITTLGTIASGLWQATVISPVYGGTGINNGTSTLILGGSLNTSGAFTSTFTMTGVTNVTFPTSGTLATTSQIPTGAALTKGDDTNVTLTLAGSPTTALVNAASITAGWTGTLSLTRGGTAASLTASNGGIFYSTASAGAILSGTATAQQLLMSGASTAPIWSTSTYPTTNAINTLLYASSANVMAALATANSSVLITNSTGVPSMSGALTNGQVIIGSTGATPTAATLTAGANITITNAAGSITIANTGNAAFAWQTTASTSFTAAVNTGYVLQGATTAITLPTTFAVGDIIGIAGSQGTWTVTKGGSTSIISMGVVYNSFSSANNSDSLVLVGQTANSTWSIVSMSTKGFTFT